MSWATQRIGIELNYIEGMRYKEGFKLLNGPNFVNDDGLLLRAKPLGVLNKRKNGTLAVSLFLLCSELYY